MAHDVIVIFILVTCCCTCLDAIQDRWLDDPQTILLKIQEQNRKLSRQAKRLNMVWTGMQEMCSALHTDEEVTEEPAQVPTPTELPNAPEAELELLSVTVDDIGDDEVFVSVNYTAPVNHTTMWQYTLRHPLGDEVLLTSKVSIRSSDGSFSTSMLFTNQSHGEVNFLAFAGAEGAVMRIRVGKTYGRQILPVKDTRVFQQPSYVAAEPDSDLIVEIALQGNLQDIDNSSLGRPRFYFEGVNTSKTPPEMFEISTENGLTVDTLQVSPDKMVVLITVRSSFARLGGFLTPQFPVKYDASSNGFVEELLYGHVIEVLSPDGPVVPINTLVLYTSSIPDLKIIHSSWTLACIAVGRPRPEVEIWKVTSSGKRQVPSETILSGKYQSGKCINLHAGKPREAEGRYICRASIGDKVVQKVTRVKVYRPVRFSAEKTGVVNTTDEVVVSCKASGSPRPQLSLHLNSPQGPELTKEMGFEVSIAYPSTKSARVTAVFSPTVLGQEDRDVFCVASKQGKKEYRQIALFGAEH